MKLDAVFSLLLGQPGSEQFSSVTCFQCHNAVPNVIDTSGHVLKPVK